MKKVNRLRAQVSSELLDGITQSEPLPSSHSELTLLYEAGQLMGATLHLPTLYKTLRQLVSRTMDLDGMFVSSYDSLAQTITCRYAWVEGSEADVSEFPVLNLGSGLQSDVIRSRSHILVDDFFEHAPKHDQLYYANAEGSLDSSPDEATTRSLVMVPMILDDLVLGVVQVQSHRIAAYRLSDLRMLEALTAQVAAASRNAVLYDRMTSELDERRRVEAENLHLLNELQKQSVEQHKLLTDVLASVTEGKLQLCRSSEELPSEYGAPVEVQLRSSGDLRTARAALVAVARQCDFPDQRLDPMLAAFGEAAMNAVVHAGRGVCRISSSDDREQLVAVIEDQGKGIELDLLPRATLERGYTTAGSLGHGFWIILNSIDRIHLLSRQTGTTIMLTQDRHDYEPAWAK